MIMGEIRLKIVLTGRAVGRLRRSTMIKHRLKKRERMMRQRMRIGEVNLESDRGGNFPVSFNEWNSIKVCYTYSLFSVNNSHPDSSKYFRYIVETLVTELRGMSLVAFAPGGLCVAQWRQDNVWYRARVDSVDNDGL